MKRLKGELLEDFDWNGNDFSYKKGQIVEISVIEGVIFNYATYKDGNLDWLPKSIVKIN